MRRITPILAVLSIVLLAAATVPVGLAAPAAGAVPPRILATATAAAIPALPAPLQPAPWERDKGILRLAPPWDLDPGICPARACQPWRLDDGIFGPWRKR